MSKGPTQIRPRILAPLAWMAMIFAFSAQPDLNTGLGFWDFVGRKLAHMASFGFLCWLWIWALELHFARPIAWAAAISLAYAVSDEYHQSFVEGRHGTPLDVAIDALGIYLAVLLWRRKTG